MEMNPAWLKPRQRILQRDGKRMSIRLEEEFWEQLEFCAKDEGVKLTDLVFSIIGEAEASNRTSLLRIYCARWMRRKVVQTFLTKSNADIQGIIASCPVPCVIVSSEKRLIAQNTAFSEQVLGSLLSPDMWSDADTVVRFSLSKPIDRIIEELTTGSGSYVETNVAFTRGAAIVQMVGRFCTLNPKGTEGSPLICFLGALKKKRQAR